MLTSLDKEDLLKRLNRRTVIQGDCWLWTGATSHGGHGKMGIRVENMRYTIETSRLSAYIHLGLDLNDRDQLACHRRECPNVACWNPAHLYVGNKKSNMRDYVAVTGDLREKGVTKDHARLVKRLRDRVMLGAVELQERGLLEELEGE